MSVSIKSLEKSYSKTKILKGIDLEIDKGEFFVLLGFSGSGKTTLLRCIAGLEKVDSGKIIIDGVDVTNLEPSKRGVSMVFQNYVLYPHKTVYENLLLPVEDKKDAKKKIEEISKALGIHELLDRMPSQLSGGQQQRVALARALIKNPRVLLMDEPLSNLDAPQRISARRFIKELQRKENITTIYVTHDQIEAMALADRIAVMKDGKILQIGKPEEIYNDPINEFVGSFIGDPPMSIINGNFMKIDKKIGIRADDVVIGDGELEGEVVDVEFINGKYLVHIKFNGSELRGYYYKRINEGEKIKFEIKKYRVF
ncbi:ATPase component of ABC-type sugar transporter [Caldisphaera lagunensis DSM 15908]|uniref:ATPase component of ABC-type sugar transporter n=1 Tax=Caldisphaera lagunensis (strain DSM 15908 / JCM 11604 / ANMR 0165 / IC-154) TaxID=1056495 RepID=L0AAA2_CALLD|nr:ABC transporter ATP-binding protein [Caldisphaera lagunensis]AFZ70796.1 ATPase component of ABC-type sugar transporter [Caldisphaera lagunensis DSM 15908]